MRFYLQTQPVNSIVRNDGVSFVRKGTYDPDVDEHILIYEGKTYYSLVDRPELIVLPFQTALNSVSIKVQCFSGSQLINSRDVYLDILQEVNKNAYFTVPDSVDAYEHSTRISVPLSSTDAFGNAPSYSVEVQAGAEKSNITVSVEYIYEVESKYSGTAARNVLDLYFVGQGLYIAETSNSMNVLYCESRPIAKQGSCSLLDTVKFFNRQILDGQVEGDFLITLEASTLVAADQSISQTKANNVSVFLRDVQQPSKGTEFLEPNLRGSVGALKVYGNNLYAMVVGTLSPNSAVTLEQSFPVVGLS